MQEEGFSFDLAGTVVGVSKTKPLLGNAIKSKDIIIGVHSSGLHSNGYTLARKALLSKFSLKDKIRSKGTIGQALLEPTPMLKVRYISFLLTPASSMSAIIGGMVGILSHSGGFSGELALRMHHR